MLLKNLWCLAQVKLFKNSQKKPYFKSFLKLISG